VLGEQQRCEAGVLGRAPELRRRDRAGVTIRWRRPNSRANAWAARLRKQPTPSSTPSARSDVIRTSGSPQAITEPNGDRSLSTLTAKPCMLTRRDTWIPIDAILRSSTHTQVSSRPSRRCAATPASRSAVTSAASIVSTNARTFGTCMIG
jgi:hypothetical protein